MDMKGGNYVYLDALRKLLAAGIETPLPVTVLFTPDEEIGTPSTRALIETEAKRHKYILVPEPARPDGGAVIGRYAIARFELQTRGRPSHAGWQLAKGRSAIARMARAVAEIEGMTTEDCTFSLGVFHAGQWVNCVSSVCDAEVLTMAKTQELLDEGVEKMLALNDPEAEVVMEVRRGVTRPVWEPDQPGTMAMLKLAQEIAGEIGFEMSGASAGGGSDGNFTGALGLPTLDSIGVRGADLHTLNEHIHVDSLVERARLAAALYCRLGA
jgi:glutamate carboxypeptidase